MTPRITGVLETALYAEDLPSTASFYETVLGLPVMVRHPRMVAFEAGAASVLLVFQRGATDDDLVSPNGTVPGHNGAGRLHVALAIPAGSQAEWRARLIQYRIAIIGEQRWPRGGVSLYVHDPDRHVIELATPGLWPNY